MSVKVCLTAAELDALAGLPHICWVLYLAIREAMDGRTGIAGEIKRVSWWQFQEACYVEPKPGRRGTGTPTLKTLRLAAASLRRAELILFMSDAWAGELKFKCPKAPIYSLAQNKVGRGISGQLDRGLRPEKPHQVVRAIYDEVGRHLEKYLSIKNIETSLERRDARAPPDESVEKRPGTNRLLFNGVLNPTEQRRVRDLLQRQKFTLQSAQILADELHGWIRQGKSTAAPIRNPVGYLKSIIKTSLEPGWEPRYAAEVAQERADLSRHPNLPDDPTRASGPARPAAVEWSGLPANIAKRAKIAGH